MTEWTRTLPKRSRFHKSVDEFLDDLNSRSDEEMEPLAQWLGVKLPMKFLSKEGTEDDFRGVDFLIEHPGGTITVQDKLRQRRPNTSNPSSGKDIGVEIIRMYGFNKDGEWKIAEDFGRDLSQIPRYNVPIRSEDNRFVVVRNSETSISSDLYVVHPHNEDQAVWCNNKYLKMLAKKCADRFLLEYAQDNTSLHVRVRDSFRHPGSQRIDQLFTKKGSLSEIQLFVGRDVDKKPVYMENVPDQTYTALISKVIAYIRPDSIGESGSKAYIKF